MWPSSYGGRGDPIKRRKGYDDNLSDLKNIFVNAMAYADTDHREKDIRLEAMKGLFDGSQTLFVKASLLEEIKDAVNFCKAQGVVKMVLFGARDSYMCTGFLKENNIFVMLPSAIQLPNSEDDDIDMKFKTPSILQEAGVKFCIHEDWSTYDVRNLPFWAGMAVGNGLTLEQGLTAITLSVAEILGVDDILGSLVVGKHATLFVSTGDALDIKSNNVTLAYIQGRKIDLNDRHKAIAKQFKQKYLKTPQE